MSSILTNASAMTALQTLNNTNKELESTQNRISTGLRVSEASDNAAYWSISTTMKSDNKAMSTVQDALGLGSATVDVAYTAMESTKDALDEIKTKLVAAKQPGVDKSKIQSEISQLQNQIEGIASAANFSGSNWLQVDSSSSDYSGTEKIVSSFSRGSDGSLSIGTIDVALSDTALFDASATGTGLLDKGADLAADGGLQDVGEAAGDGTTAATVQPFADASAGLTMDANDEIKFDVALNGESKTVTINKSVIDTALGAGADGAVADQAEMVTVVQSALENAGFDTTNEVSVAANGTAVELTNEVGVTTGDTLEIANSAQTDNGNFSGALNIDISNATSAELDAHIAEIDGMTDSVTSAAADLGAAKSRIDLQKDFVSSIMDAVDRGVGQLVDADMNDESTKLKALQTQQQLGIQALSIANSSSQNILSLFR